MTTTTYETDFYGWTQQQAALLKASRFSDIDLSNIIEEIETMGRSEYRALESRLTVLLQHLLKWKFQSERRSKSWELSIDEQRIRFDRLLRENPSLKSALNTILTDAYRLAVVKAAKETKFDKKRFPAVCPWSLEEITDSEFYPE
jgi:hypothetical protein